MYRQPRSQRHGAAQAPSRDTRGGDNPRTEKKSMSQDDQLALAEDLEAINASFLEAIGDSPSDKVVEQALRDISHEHKAWLKELHALSLSYHEPLHLIVDALFVGDLEPELASLFVAQEGRLREINSLLEIGDFVGTLPEDSYRKTKMDYLLALDPATVEHFEGPREDRSPKKRQVVKGIANRIKARSEQTQKQEWGPVRVAFNAVVDRNGMTWDDYRNHVEQNTARRPKRSDTQTTRPSAKAGKDTSEGKVVRPSEKAKAENKAAERPSRKTHTPEPAVRPSAKTKAGTGKASAKPARPSARRTGTKAPKSQLDQEAKDFVKKLRSTNSGNEAIANSIADALEQGEYTLAEATDKVAEAGIQLAKSAKS